jgi:hypothetical protein
MLKGYLAQDLLALFPDYRLSLRRSDLDGTPSYQQLLYYPRIKLGSAFWCDGVPRGLILRNVHRQYEGIGAHFT